MTIADSAAPRASTKTRFPEELSGMWLFVIGDMVIFAGWLGFYLADRTQQMDLFLDSQRALSQDIGAINTMILLTSSWFMALCVHFARVKKYKWAAFHVSATIACGVGFIISKAIEWSDKIAHGHGFASNDFFKYYYFLTGIHLFHVIVGFVALGIVLREVATPKFRSMAVVEAGGFYWHMIDFLWVIIFALLYLMR